MTSESIDVIKNLFSKLFNYTYGETTIEVTDILDRTEDDTVYFTVNYSVPRFSTEGTMEFYVPDDSNSLVVTDSKYRVQITSARRNNVLKFYSSVKVKMNQVYISIPDDILSTGYGDDTQYLSLMSVCKYFGVLKEFYGDTNPNEVDDLNQEEVEILNSISINEDLLTKFEIISEGKINLKSSMNFNGTYKITREFIKFIMDALVTGEGAEKYDVETPLDFSYMTAIDGLSNEILMHWRVIHDDIRFNMDKNHAIYPSVTQNLINKYYNMQAKGFRDVQVPNDSNALSMLVQSKKMYFYEKNADKNWVKSRIYNKYFVGVLDPVKSVDSENINIDNSLTNRSQVSNGKMLITVLDKDFNNVTLEYSKYITSPIMSYENIDYANKVVKLINGVYTYSRYGNYYTTTDLDDIKYYKCEDNMNSPATACVPFINRMAGARAVLATHVISQSIPTVGTKPGIIATPANKEIYEESPYNTRSDYDGEVVDIYDGYIKIRDLEGNDHIVGDGVKYINTANHTTNLFHNTVKVGDIVYKGDVVIEMNSFRDHEFTTSVPLVTMYGPYLGYGYEDGIILTESAAKKFAHIQVTTVSITIPWNIKVKFINNVSDPKYDYFSLIKVGESVNAGDNLMQYYQYLLPNEMESVLKRVITGENTPPMTLNTVRAPLDIESGTVRDVRVRMATEDNQYTEFTEYYDERNTQSIDRHEEFFGTTNESDYQTDGSVLFQIDITIEYLSTVEMNKLSGKITNFYYAKGVNTHIIADSDAPYDEFGNKIECIITSVSMYSRQNYNQLHACKLGLVCLEGWKFIKDKSKDDPKVIEFLKVMYPYGYDWDSLMHDGNSYGYIRAVTNSMDDYYSTEIVTKLFSLIGIPNNGDTRVFIPKLNKWTDNKCTVGVLNMMRLHFIQTDRAKATSSTEFETPSDNLAYQNVRKDEGQKIGEQEVWSLLAHGQQDLLTDLASRNDDKGNRYISAFLALGLGIR